MHINTDNSSLKHVKTGLFYKQQETGETARDTEIIHTCAVPCVPQNGWRTLALCLQVRLYHSVLWHLISNQTIMSICWSCQQVTSLHWWGWGFLCVCVCVCVVCVCVCVCVCVWCVCVCGFMWFMRTQICIMTWVWQRYYNLKVVYEDTAYVPVIQKA